MRIHSVRLVDFRGVADATVRLSPGVTVIEGPNETGKSSIAEALRLLRDFKATSGHKDIRAVQPVDRDVGPEVTLSLTTGPFDLVYRKRWLRKPETELRVSAPHPEQHAGDTAHDRFLDILGQTLDLDLLLALEVQQGASLAQPDLARIAALHRTLDEAGDPSADHDELMDLIEQEHRRFFTPTGRPTGEYRAGAEELPGLEREVADLAEQGRRLDGLVERHRALSGQLDALDARLARATADLRAREAAARDLDRRRGAADLSGRALEEATRTLERAEEALVRRRELLTAVEDRRGELQELAAAAAGEEDGLRAAEDAFASAERAASGARDAHKGARDRAQRAAAALTRLRDAHDRRELAGRVERARAAHGRLVDATAALESAPDLPAGVLEDLTSLSTDLTVAERTRDLAAAQVRVEALGDRPLLLDGEALAAGSWRSMPAHAPVTVEVPGLARITVTPGTTGGSAEQGADRARAALSEALARAGVESVEQAAALIDRRRLAEAARQEARRDLDRELSGDDLDMLEARLAGLAARLRAAGGPAAEPEHPLDADAADLEAAAHRAQDDEEKAAEALAQALDVLEQARAARDAASARDVRAGARRDTARAELDRAEAALEAARAQEGDASLEEALTRAAQERDACREAALADLDALEQADPDTVETLLDNARRLVDSTRENRSDTHTEAAQAKALVDSLAAEGIETRLAEAQAHLAEARLTQARLERDARAARLLRDTMVRHRDLAQRRYVAPFTQRIERLGRVVFGPDLRIGITPDLVIESRTLGGRTVPFDSLSAGAREQLALLGRLACAQLVSGDEGAPVVLDDTLGYSDPERLARLGAVLGAVGSSAQVIVLTCQPDRFASVGGAKVVRLPPPTP